MQIRRHLTLLARLVLAGWLLSLGVAIAAPVVQPPSLELICAGGVMKLRVQSDAQAPAADTAGGADCPLCAVHGGLPPPDRRADVPFTQRTDPPALSVATRVVALTGAPLPARGPPAGERR